MVETPPSVIDLTGATGGAGSGPISDRLAAAGEALRTAFTAACEQENVRGLLLGPPARMVFSFEQQEGASPERILEAFLGELRSRGVLAGPELCPPPGLSDREVQAAAAALRDAVRRLHALMIENNSYLSGGLPWVFEAGSELLQSRGLCTYRYPARAEVDVKAAGNSVRITFHPGPLGEVTSSGFYLPTRVRGDVTALVRFRLRGWAPGADNACLALFAQDEPSMVRFYAQRFTEAADPDRHLAQANLHDEASAPVPVTGDAGAFRLTRRANTITAWYRGAEDWVRLGEKTMPDAPDLFFGAKIWSGAECGGLEAELFDLVIDGEIPHDQPAAPTERPDPRLSP